VGPTGEAPPGPSAATIAPTGAAHTLWQFIRFCLVGASGVVVNLAVFTLTLLVALWLGGHLASISDVTHAIHELVTRKDTAGVSHAAVYLANALGFVVSVLTNYYLNRRWTFRSTKDVAGELPKFFTVSVVAYCGQLAVFWLFHTKAHVAPIPSQLVAIAFVMPINFIANKLWSFR